MEAFQPGQLVQLINHPERVVQFDATDDDGMAVCWWDGATGAREHGRFHLHDLQPYVRRASLFRPDLTHRQSERRY
jgi:uncharacterized protein YodC (DUF2158 family)